MRGKRWLQATNALQKNLIMPCLAVLLLFCSASAQTPERRTKPRPPGVAVVEIFTAENSPSLESTASAAQLIDQQRVQGQNVYVLTFHVDYLNTARWSDEYSKLSYTERQRQYAAQFHLTGLRANLAVINGQYAATGDAVGDIRARIWRGLTAPAPAVITIDKKRNEAGTLNVGFKVDRLQKMRRDFFYFHAALVENGVESRINDGMNMGKKVPYINLVRAFEMSRFDGRSGEGSVELPVAPGLKLKDCMIIAWVQDPQNNKVIGATATGLDN